MRKKIKSKVKLERTVGFTTIVLTSILMLSFLFPTNTNNTNAVTADSSNPITDSAKLKAETYVYSTLAVSLSESVNLDVVPKAGGSFTTGGANLTVTTNNTTGYQVYLQTGDNTSTLRPANGMIDAEIKPVVGEMNESNFHQNLDTWGYAIGQAEASLNSMNYKALPSASSPAVITTDQLAAKDSYTLGFATAVSPNLPAGKYYNSVLVSVVANPIAVHTLSGITYMQEMSPYVCDYSDEHETKQLIDTRDGKSYWVAKLKDGNCWMVQNLALDLDVNENGNAVAVSEGGKQVELNSGNTNISGVWNQNVPIKTTEGLPIPGTVAQTGSWNIGEIVLKTPTQASDCPQAIIPDDDHVYPNTDKYNSAYHGQKLSDTCSDAYVDVTGWDDVFSSTITSSVDISSRQYDAHYLVGNYYQYGAATAGSGINLYNSNEAKTDPDKLVNALESICPSNWQLPVGGGNLVGQWPFDLERSYYRLLHAYGYPETGNSSTGNVGIPGWSASSGFGYISLTGDGVTRLDYSPMYFVRSGFISLSAGSLRFANNRGEYYSGTPIAGADNAIYGLGLEPSIVYPSGSIGRTWGVPIRCIAK